jgi:dienelactone hydrolase
LKTQLKFSSLLALLVSSASLLAQTPQGLVKGSAHVHTTESAQAVIAGAQVALPASVTGGLPFAGPWRNLPSNTQGRAPVVVFLHGGTGLKLAAILEWQQWLASHGFASIAPDSFALPERLTYTSPVAKDVYEKLHTLRATEIALALAALQGLPWADTRQLILAGTSEGSIAVARHNGNGFLGKLMFAWSCEDNYFVDAHQTFVNRDLPVLNIISNTDPFFSPSNSWLGNPAAKGHCGAALKGNSRASVVLLPDAPHTLFNLSAARQAVMGFLRELLPR